MGGWNWLSIFMASMIKSDLFDLGAIRHQSSPHGPAWAGPHRQGFVGRGRFGFDGAGWEIPARRPTLPGAVQETSCSRSVTRMWVCGRRSCDPDRDHDMVVLAVHRDIEFGGSQMEIVRHGRNLCFGRLEQFRMEISPFTACFRRRPAMAGNRVDE